MIRRFLVLGAMAGLMGVATPASHARFQDKKEAPPAKEAAAKPKGVMKVSVIKIITSGAADVELTVKGDKESDDKKLRTQGEVREFKTPPLEVGKKYEYTIEALIVPNNYTKITRPRKVTFLGGADVTIDMTKDDMAIDKTVVRWVPTPDEIVDEMAKLARVGAADTVMDIGCGDGIMLIRPVKLLNAKKGVGIEYDEKMVKEAKERVDREGLKDKIEIRQGDINKLTETDLKSIADSSVILLYIGEELGGKLEPILKKNLKPGARIVSHRFGLGGWKPDKTTIVKGKDGEEYTLNLWEVPAK